MRKIYTLAFLLLAMTVSFAQTIYSEDFGTPVQSGTTWPAVTAYTGYETTTVTYTGTASARATGVSTGYEDASGSGNIYFGDTQTFIVSGINTSPYDQANLELTFGQYHESNLTGDVTANFTIEKSTDGTNWTAINYTRTSTSGWELVTVGDGLIPSAANLSLRFTRTSTKQFRIDDLKVKAVSSSCLLSLGSATAVCDALTLSTADTYTATIPYTGGSATATYTITLTSGQGTITGNPATAPEGNIVVTGIPEGMEITVHVVGATCDLTKTIIGATCKPINALPYYDGFDYNTGTVLGTSQKWAAANSGDDVVVAEGNLNYTGIPAATGKSVTYAGAGKEAYTPFTITTAGKIYSSFLFSVTDIANVTDTEAGTVVATFIGTDEDPTMVDPTQYKGRLFVKKAGNQYQLAATTATTATTYTSTSYNVGDTVFVILGYDFATNAFSAWINPTVSAITTSTPATLTETAATPVADLGGFLLRQDTATITPSITFDELRIGTTLADVITTTAGVKSSEIAGLSIYPNPLTGNILNITSNSNAAKKVAIFDVLGKQVLNTTTVNGTVNTGNLTAGIYLVKVTEEGKTATKKLVVQ